MTLVRSLGPRNPRAAVQWAAWALIATIVTSQVLQALTDPSIMTAATIGTGLLVLALGLLLLLAPVDRVAPWVVLAPLLGMVGLAVLDLLTADAGVTGMVFFVLPVVYAAALLRGGAVLLVAVATAAGVVVVAVSALPTAEAVPVIAYVTVVVALVAAVLGRTAARHEQLVHRLRQLADLDLLTGLATRRVLDAAADRLGAAGGALVLIDLDAFKAVNDTHGHLGGDAALAHVADLLRAGCRGEDVAARLGGDELAVLLVGCSADDATRRAQDLVQRVRATPLVLRDGTRVPLSVSIGVAAARASDLSLDDLYARADAALYDAKRAGRDRAVTAAH